MDQPIQSQSPTAQPIKEAEVEKLMKFPEAISAITDGKKVTKISWENKEYFSELRDGLLKLHKPDGRYYEWTVNEGDMTGEDWVIIN